MVGTGISGGWAAKELCENGLKTLVLERGRMVKHVEDCPTMNDDEWDYPLRGELSQEDARSLGGGEVCLNRTEQPYIRTDVLINGTKKLSRSYISHK